MYLDEIASTAGIMAVATHEPGKLKDVLPKRKGKDVQQKDDFDQFNKDFGSF